MGRDYAIELVEDFLAGNGPAEAGIRVETIAYQITTMSDSHSPKGEC